jgi:hypothetical protein
VDHIAQPGVQQRRPGKEVVMLMHFSLLSCLDIDRRLMPECRDSGSVPRASSHVTFRITTAERPK